VKFSVEVFRPNAAELLARVLKIGAAGVTLLAENVNEVLPIFSTFSGLFG
jgi:hypothetical protein